MSPRINAVVRPAQGVVFRRLQTGKGAVLLKLETGAYHSLNETGALLWELMAEGRELDGLVAEFGNLLDDWPTELPVDVQDFFEQLSRRDLVELDLPSHDKIGPSGP